MGKIVSLEKEKAKRKDTFVSMFLRQHDLGYNPYVASKLLGKYFGIKEDGFEETPTHTSPTSLGALDVLLYYMINNIDDWDKETIKAELEDLRYEIQGMRNTLENHRKIKRKQSKALIAAWSIESNTNILNPRGYMYSAPADIFKLWDREYSKKVNEFCKQYDYAFLNEQKRKLKEQMKKDNLEGNK